MTSSPRDWLSTHSEPLQITLVTTTDDDIGMYPPTIDDDGVWHVVRSSDGRTTWRRIHLEP